MFPTATAGSASATVRYTAALSCLLSFGLICGNSQAAVLYTQDFVGNPLAGQVTRTNVFESVANVPQETVTFGIMLDDTVGTFGANQDLQHGVHFRGPNTNMESFFVYKGTTNGSNVVTQNRFEMRSGSTQAGPNTVLADTWYNVTLNFDWVAGNVSGEVRLDDNSLYWTIPTSTGFFNNGNTNFFQITGDSVPASALFIRSFQIGEADPLPPPPAPEPSTGLLLALASLAPLARRMSRQK